MRRQLSRGTRAAPSAVHLGSAESLAFSGPLLVRGFLRLRLRQPSSAVMQQQQHHHHHQNRLHSQYCTSVARIVPVLGGAKYKGQAGRVGVFGGSPEYTGAPYFAAMAALRSGVDLVHVYCHPDAAGPIKAYSPELIVHPALVPGETPGVMRARAMEWMQRLDSVVVGPGLGRECQWVGALLEAGVTMGIPMVVDADGLFYLSQHTAALNKRRDNDKRSHIWLTCNKMEYDRLQIAVLAAEPCADVDGQLLAKLMGATVIVKGESDQIISSSDWECCRTPGMGRRCGGQGDVLAGTLGALAAWQARAPTGAKQEQLVSNEEPQTAEDWADAVSDQAVGYVACHLTRRYAASAFACHRRATVTGDVLAAIPAVFECEYPSDVRST